jgi:hypothetical protein
MLGEQSQPNIRSFHRMSSITTHARTNFSMCDFFDRANIKVDEEKLSIFNYFWKGLIVMVSC